MPAPEPEPTPESVPEPEPTPESVPEPEPTPESVPELTSASARRIDRRAVLIASATGLAAAGGAAAWVFGPGTDPAAARTAPVPSSRPPVTLPPRTPSVALRLPIAPTTEGTTLRSVAAPSARSAKNGFRRLVDGPGWTREVRTDLASAHAGREKRRTPLAAFVQLTDLHVMDVQSPLRFEWMRVHSSHDWRPHEALSAAGTLALIERVNSLRAGPVTGHPLSFAITTGDNTDNNSTIELDWFLTAMSGGTLVPNSGDPQAYEGIQNSRLGLFWQPEDTRTDADKKLGFPHLPGYLAAAIRPLAAPGLNLPWYSTVGNHDALFSGAYVSGSSGSFAAQVATGGRKVEQVAHADALKVYKAVQAHKDPAGDLIRQVIEKHAGTARTVTADERRRPFTPQEYLAAHLEPRRTGPGPHGHGYAAEGVDADHMYYSFPVAPGVLGISLDTTDRGGSFLGSLGTEQLNWLDATLTAHQDQHVLVFSHHTSRSMTNLRPDPARPDEKRHSGAELTALLKKHTHVLAWINGHSHLNRIESHGSFWEVNTASHVDYPQLARVIELVDNHDGTLSLITTLIESAAPHRTDFEDLSASGLASLYRELAFNAPGAQVTRFTGAKSDRNTELLLKKR